MRSESVDPSSEALLLLPDISARMCVCQHTICIYRVDVVCVCVLPAESDLEFFLESVLGMSYAMQAHSYREYILPFKFDLHQTQNTTLLARPLSLPSLVLAFFLFVFYFTFFGLFCVKYFSIVCRTQYLLSNPNNFFVTCFCI